MRYGCLAMSSFGCFRLLVSVSVSQDNINRKQFSGKHLDFRRYKSALTYNQYVFDFTTSCTSLRSEAATCCPKPVLRRTERPARNSWPFLLTEFSEGSNIHFKRCSQPNNGATDMTHTTRTGLIREVKEEGGKFFAWNECRNEWYRIAKTKVNK